MIKWFVKGVNPLVIVWVVLSFLLLLCSYFFRVNDYVSNPQHGLFDNFDVITKYIQNNNKVFWYRAYFIVDFIWAFFFLTTIGYLVLKMNEQKTITLKHFSVSLVQLFSIFALVAYVLDVLEGVGYLFYLQGMLKIVAPAKLIAYALCLGFFMYWVLKKYVFTDFRSIYRFLQTSILSIVFIILIYLLLTVMPQGGTLIVDLFYRPLNLLILFTLLTFLAIIISHFPVYVGIWLYGSNKAVELIMAKHWMQFLGFGIIYYSTFKKPGSTKGKFSNRRVDGFRRSLGILLYIAVFNIFLGVTSRFYEADLNATGFTVMLLLLTLLIYQAKGSEYTYWKNTLYSSTSTAQEREAVIKTVVAYVNRFPKYLMFCLGMVLLTVIVTWVYKWSQISLWVFFVTLGFQMFLYVYFKICRTYFKYVFYSKKLYDFNPEMFNPQLLALFKQYDANHSRGESWYLRQYGKLSDNVRYLTLMQISGISSFVMLLLANFSFEFASWLNPLIIILLYIIFFYSVIIITFKHVLYYHRAKGDTLKYREFFRYGIPITVMFLIGWMGFSAGLPNDLHQLKVAERTEKQLSSANYLINRTQHIPAGTKENFFFVGSYGGGLKANLWNLLLFNELDKHTDNGFRKNTLVMSGVSGGAVGIANYASLVLETKAGASREQAIYNIGTSNVLSNELVYLLGKDWVREYIPVTHNGRDRSFKSMQNHAVHTGMGADYNTITYSDYWRKIYAKEDGKFPMLLMNTTSTLGRQGVAATVGLIDNTFPAADIISDFTDNCNNCDLMFFGAVSTTNRFPLFSPSAEIPGKGSYVDGGYFENSGMLSTLELYQTFVKEGGTYSTKIQPVFVNIINSQDYYIANKVLNEWHLKKATEAKTGELSAILSTVVSIDKLPRYVFDKIEKNGYAIEAIMMPHKLSYKQVKDILRGDVDDPIRLMKLIKQHNDTIDRVLQNYKPYNMDRWGVVTPPLARILSEPAVRYQEAMVRLHPEMLRAFERIDAYLAADTIVDDNFKRKLEEQVNFNYKNQNLDLNKKKQNQKANKKQ